MTARSTSAAEFIFSVILPVYNASEYLRDAIDSVIRQTVGFEDHIQLVLIEDGSEDDSGVICAEYAERYPKNITFITHDRNYGVSVTRNDGLDAAKGKYISFLDSDDKLSPTALTDVKAFFDEHQDEVDVVAMKIKFFEDKVGPHQLNYKFGRDRVIDVTTEYNAAVLHLASCVVRAEAMEGHRFNRNLHVSEDMELLTKIILKRMAYGVVSRPTYFYRKRKAANSAIDSSRKKKTWYTATIEHAYRRLFEVSRDENGQVPRYVQFLIAYDLQWRFTQVEPTVLSPEEERDYKKALLDLICDIDDQIIFEQRHLPLDYKFFLLRKKHDDATLRKAELKGWKYIFDGLTIRDYIAQPPIVNIEFLQRRGKALIIEGNVTQLWSKKDKVVLVANGKKYKLRGQKSPHRQKRFLDEVVVDGSFIVEVPVAAGDLHFELEIGERSLRLPIQTQRFSYLSDVVGAYRRFDDAFIRRSTKNTLSARPYARRRHVLYEISFALRLMAGLKLRYSVEEFMALRDIGLEGMTMRSVITQVARPFLIPPKNLLMNIRALFVRGLAYVARGMHRSHKIWLVSDRTAAAGDNGEALFRHIMKHPTPGVMPIFAIAKSSPHYRRMKQCGKVVNRFSLRYRILFLVADKVISSHADDFVYNAFGDREYQFIDLYRFDYVFLQHGIIKDDLSSWLHRYWKNIKLFVTSATPEYKSILDGNYEYGPDVVKLTGLPRYDLLEDTQEGKLILAPTWRRNLIEEANQRTGKRPYSADFKHSAYYKFYDGLMNDEKILTALRKHGMSGEFYLHPSHAEQADDFKGNDLFVIKRPPYDYQDAFAKGTLLVTDYSSVAFDFTYLKKPVLYTQFDRDTFYQGHLYTEGYFSYERDGFGPVTYDYETSRDAIIQLLDQKGKPEPKYRRRAEKFFYRFDRRNSQRVYRAILDMDKK